MGTQRLTRDAVLAYAKETFGTEPEYLWERDPDSAVLRHPASRKWYAAILRVGRERLGLDGGGMADVLDLKCDPALVGALRTREGFLPAYHMNKERWVGVLLDGTASAAEVLPLLELAYGLVAPKRKRKTVKKADSG